MCLGPSNDKIKGLSRARDSIYRLKLTAFEQLRCSLIMMSDETSLSACEVISVNILGPLDTSPPREALVLTMYMWNRNIENVVCEVRSNVI